MKWLKVIVVGIVGWGLGLVWPEVNNLLTVEVMIGLGLGLGGLILVYLLYQHIDHEAQHHDSNGAGQNHHQLPPDQTGPLPVLRHLT